MAEEFILQHHSSYVSLYLLDKYFVQKETPDFSKIKKLVEVMTGVLQDKPYIERLNETITQAEKSEIGKYAPFFSLPNAKGEKITRSSDAFKQKKPADQLLGFLERQHLSEAEQQRAKRNLQKV